MLSHGTRTRAWLDAHEPPLPLWTPQGPRVLTFFMYLNDPEAGGETAFPTVAGGLKVQPKLGHAILWPSTRHDTPMQTDGRTDHEAMPVHAGVKYGANMWVHQFDFKTPSERGTRRTHRQPGSFGSCGPLCCSLSDGPVRCARCAVLALSQAAS